MAQYEEEEFINMAQLAHKAFSVSTDGPYRYQEWLQSLRRLEIHCHANRISYSVLF